LSLRVLRGPMLPFLKLMEDILHPRNSATWSCFCCFDFKIILLNVCL